MYTMPNTFGSQVKMLLIYKKINYSNQITKLSKEELIEKFDKHYNDYGFG